MIEGDGGYENDTITLNGASVTGDINGNAGADVIRLLSGSVDDVDGWEDNDTITMNGASVADDVFGGSGDDVIALLSGSVGLWGKLTDAVYVTALFIMLYLSAYFFLQIIVGLLDTESES